MSHENEKRSTEAQEERVPHAEQVSIPRCSRCGMLFTDAYEYPISLSQPCRTGQHKWDDSAEFVPVARARELEDALRPYVEKAAPHEQLFNGEDFRNFERAAAALGPVSPSIEETS